MTTASILPIPRFVAYDANGNPLAGGFVTTTVPGGSTPATTWQDAAETTPNENPVPLDAAGSALIYGSGVYQLTVTDSLGNQVPAYSGLSTDALNAAGISAAMQPVVIASTLAAGIAALFSGSAVSGVATASTLTAAITALFADNEAKGNIVYPEIFPGVTFRDNVVGYNSINTADTVDQVTAIAGYAQALAPTSGGNHNAVALFGCGTAEVDSSAVWGINTLLQDSSTRAIGTGNGRILINEFDFNVMSPNTQVIGLSVGGNSLAQPTNANAIIVNTLGSGVQWTTGFSSQDGVTPTGLALGRQSATPVANGFSQKIEMGYFDNASAPQVVTIQATGTGTSAAGGDLTIGGTVPTSLFLAGGNVNLANGIIAIAANQVVGARISGWGTSTNGTREQITAPSSVTLTALASIVSQLLTDLTTHGLIGS